MQRRINKTASANAEPEPEHIILKLEGEDADRFRTFKKKTFINANVQAARKIIIERLNTEDAAA